MDYSQAVYDKLAADVTLLALLSGGIYHNLAEEGLNREGTPDAYDADGFLLPTLVVTGRDTVPTMELRDPGTQLATTNQVVELWFYNDRSGIYPDTAHDRAYALLHDRQVTGTFKVILVNDARTRAPELNGAKLLKSDYQVKGFLGGI